MKPSKLLLFLPENLIEAIGLAHDIGHPPFGHGGEIALNYAMRRHGGFEGNAQTFRICTQLGEYSDFDGLNLTRRTLLGLIKYPALHANVINYAVYDEQKVPLNIDSFKPPKYSIYDCDQVYFDWILAPFSNKDAQQLQKTHASQGHWRTMYKSFDATIMELADDIAYGVHDLEDAIALNLVTLNDWHEDVAPALKHSFEDYHLEGMSANIADDLFSGSNRIRKKAISYLVHHFVSDVAIEQRNGFEHPLLRLKVVIPDQLEEELDTLKGFITKRVIDTPEVQTLVYKGQQMIVKLFEAIASNPRRLLEKKHYQKYLQQDDDSYRLRIICDYIAGDTDDYATRLHHKIFTPSNGSVFDRL
jgi:dGTPase